MARPFFMGLIRWQIIVQAFLYVTCDSQEQAKQIAKTMVAERLAACANVLGAIETVYWWEGEVQEGAEIGLILKTRADLVEAATNRITEFHTYEVPCIVALPVTGGSKAFLNYIAEQTTKLTA